MKIINQSIISVFSLSIVLLFFSCGHNHVEGDGHHHDHGNETEQHSEADGHDHGSEVHSEGDLSLIHI